MSQSCRENWKSKGRMVLLVGREGMKKKRGTASDYWEDKDLAVLGLTAPSTSGAPIPPYKLTIQFHPDKGISSSTSSIYPSIHLSFPQQMEIITHNNTTTNSSLSLLSPTSHPNLSSPGWRAFWSDLSSRSQWWKEIRLNHAKNATGRFWCGLAILSAKQIPRSAGQQSRRLR